jgi:DNA-binding NarL/FixJ family response regulator
LQANLYPIANDRGRIPWIAALVSDVTFRKALETKLANQLKNAHIVFSGSLADDDFIELQFQSAALVQESIHLIDRSRAILTGAMEVRVVNALLSASDSGESQPRSSPRPNVEPLGKQPSPREFQILQLLAQGKSNKEIAAVLGLSTRTVEGYRARLMAKLELHSLAEVVRYAVRCHLVQP